VSSGRRARLGERAKSSTFCRVSAVAAFSRRAVALLGSFLCAALFLCFLSPPSTQAAVPRFFVGLQGWTPPSDAVLARLHRAEVHSYRLNLLWSRVEWAPGRYNWKYYDALFLRAARADVRVLPVFLGSPAWVCNPNCRYHILHYPPRTDRARKRFYRFVYEAARRYGPNGYFWSDKGLPRAIRVKWFQVWNEPNIPNYWNNAPSPEGYARLLKNAALAVKRADRDVRVLAAGLPYSTKRSSSAPIPMPIFVRRMLAVPGVASAVDGIAVHTYTPRVSGLFEYLNLARRAMRASLGGATKPLFITEFGWATGGASGVSTTPAKQAELLRSAYGQLLERHAAYRLQGAFWFSYMDRRPKPGAAAWFGWYTGLFDRNGRAKPSWREYTAVTGGLP
jgi:polysaccharide biosynthesis protein PslG